MTQWPPRPRDLDAVERGCAGRTPLDLRDQAIVALLKTTAARNSSVRLLRLEDVDLHANAITFKRAKADRTYQVALLSEAKAALVRYLHRGRPKLLPRYPVRGFEDIAVGEDPGYVFLARDNGRRQWVGRLTANGLSEMIERRYRQGGGTLPTFRSHRIRHGTATVLGNNGMRPEELMLLMGQSSTKTTLRYSKPTAEAIGRATEAALHNGGLSKAPRRAA